MTQVIHHLSIGSSSWSNQINIMLQQNIIASPFYARDFSRVFMHLGKVLSCLLMFFLSACSSDQNSPEQQIRSVLALMEQASQERSTSGVLEHVSERYSDHLGHTKKEIRQLVTLQVLKNKNISLFSLIRAIEIQDNSATVELSLATAGSKVDLSSESERLAADAYRVSLLMNLEDSHWRVSSASWKRGW